MYYNRKKYLIKNIVIISFILLVAVFATNRIYYKFTEARNQDYSSDSLDITFHDVAGADIDITKPNLVNDAIGLSSKAYTLTIKNNLTEPVSYQLKLVDNVNKMSTDGCQDLQIPKELLKIAVKEDSSKNNIYFLSELENDVIDFGELAPLAEKNYAIRIWVTSSTPVNISKELHYHGTIQVLENGSSLAVR